MHCPEQYIKNNDMQRKDIEKILNMYFKKMVWKSNEIVLDIGCGPGDVTSDILYPLLKNKINQLVGVDKSIEMVEYAKKTYGCSNMDFKVLDIGNANDCSFYSNRFNKIFSFYCFHWVQNKVDSLRSMNLMLKSGGELLLNYLLITPLVELYKLMDTEWQKYIKFVEMQWPEHYIKNDGMQRKNAEDNLNMYIKKMVWKSNETVLDIGCGPGDVTSDILYPLLKNKINQLVGVDKSIEMVEYAKKTYGCSKVDFKVLNIENANDCSFYSNRFNKIFSFLCLHWVHNKADSLCSMYLMMKSGGELLLNFFLTNPLIELYTHLDAEWQTYIKDLKKMPYVLYSRDETKEVITKAGFRIINLESSVKKYTFPDLSSFIDILKPVDEMYSFLPEHLHDRYAAHVKEKICQTQVVEISPITGKTIFMYTPITVHAIKD